MNAQLNDNREGNLRVTRPLLPISLDGHPDLQETQARSEEFLANRLRARLARRLPGKVISTADFVI